MARPPKKPLGQWREEILCAAQQLFTSKGYEQTSVADIMEMAGGAKGMFYRCFQSKEEVMQAIGDRMFFQNNPFEALRKRTDLNGLQKMQELLRCHQEDTARSQLGMQAVPILRDPHILAVAVEANRRVLTPLWRELLEEAKGDGSIQSAYTQELSELLPLINFWLMPSVYPATAEELRQKYCFVAEALRAMGLPLLDEGTMPDMDAFVQAAAAKGGQA